MLSLELPSRVRSISQLVVSKTRPIANRVGRPCPAALIHEGKQYSRIDSAAKQQPDRNVGDQVPFQRTPIDVTQVVHRLRIRLRRTERCGSVAIPAPYSVT